MTTPDSSRRATRRASSESSAPEAPPARPAHARSAGRHRLAKVIGLTLTGVLAFGGTSVAAFYYKLQNNVDSVDISGLINEADRPALFTPDPEDPTAGSPVNLLLIGSDDRSGENATIGGEAGGMRSDTTIVMHISADRSRVELVSIPRDSMVNLPSCETTKGTVPATKYQMFNSAFAFGWDKGGDLVSAASCTVTAVESLTDVRLNGFIIVDFVGFEAMVNAIGGVEMDIPEEIIAPEADLHLQAGVQTLDGAQALGLARARKGVGANMDGSDLKRIGRQQELLDAMAATVLNKNILTDAPSLMKFLNAVTSSLTTSKEYSSLMDLTGLGLSLKNISPENITFLMVPIADDPKNPKNRVVWTSEATKVWERMKADMPIDGTDPAAAGTDLATDPGATDPAATDIPVDGTTSAP